MGCLLENAIAIAKNCVWAGGKRSIWSKSLRLMTSHIHPLHRSPELFLHPPETTQYCHHHYHHTVSFLLQQRLAHWSVHAIHLAVPHGGRKITLIILFQIQALSRIQPPVWHFALYTLGKIQEGWWDSERVFLCRMFLSSWHSFITHSLPPFLIWLNGLKTKSSLRCSLKMLASILR